MKKLIIALTLISFCNCLYAGDSTATDEPNPRYYHGSKGYGLMFLGGVTLTIGGITTRPERFYNNGVWQVKPFHKQGARASAIVCGISLTATGLISAIVNAPKRR